MESVRIIEALKRVRHGLLATITPTMSVHTVLVNPFWVEGSQAVGVFSRRRAQKIVNLSHCASATITLVEGSRYLSLMGSASVVETQVDVDACFEAFHEKYQRSPVQAPDRVLILLRVERTLGLLGVR
ncbi:MAG: pyridoxamine 5'-phosphate oxidase family protein [Ferrimicrobium sp.]|uniref:Pyridoxamine 5'-phosphate oxidase N-terminal domain-containing protein n=1 Tax=Ferrimicrobium acidiphilum TaxID=121039 RepID=A0ABV3Y1W5_9ACTN|nr:hypothetical protein [Ferrimicrobium sp.]MCL5972977.1 hypothetical protein [Actinomycetota bacterium]